MFKESGAASEQAISAIKVVKAFGQEEHEIKRFEKHLMKSSINITKQAWLFALSKALMESMFYIVSIFSLSIGGIFVVNEVSPNVPFL
jgi:ABC-type multidrug transport system fused ATPase/permease subunit